MQLVFDFMPLLFFTLRHPSTQLLIRDQSTGPAFAKLGVYSFFYFLPSAFLCMIPQKQGLCKSLDVYSNFVTAPIIPNHLSAFITGLLNNVGTHIDPTRLIMVRALSSNYSVRACAAGVECLVCLWVCLFVCQFVCPPLFSLFRRFRPLQVLI